MSIHSAEDMLPLSGVQHYVFCPRQWALIHVEQQWLDNRLTAEGRRLFLAAWQARKREEIVHPYLQEKIPIGLLPYAQAMQRGDIDAYPVFIIQ